MQNNNSFSSFLGLKTAEGSARRQAKKETKWQNRESRRNQKIANQTTLASMGISEKMYKKANTQNMIAGIGGAAVGIASQALGGGAAGAELGNTIGGALRVDLGEEQAAVQQGNFEQVSNVRPTTSKKWYQKNGAIIGFAVGGLAIVSVIIYFIRRN